MNLKTAGEVESVKLAKIFSIAENLFTNTYTDYELHDAHDFLLKFPCLNNLLKNLTKS